ncbi:hypothetical protein BU17DRAFT_94199 [Hysterangium stoloniferum]|nr:hypothetical protein BU17DRAFT_94199 [Hysterangium stoloniferum]
MTFDNLPKFHELPSLAGMPGCAWEVWGKDDELGTVNLLTDEVVAKAAKEEIKSGKRITLSWPINFPAKPVFGRRSPEHTILVHPAVPVVNDDELYINTQSGSQWDGLRHFGIISEGVFYQGVKPEEISKGVTTFNNPSGIDYKAAKLGIHNWAQHGICGRGVLLDLVKYFTENGTKPLPYDPWSSHAISVADLQACAEQEGVEFQQGDILVLRIGFMEKFCRESQDARDQLQKKEESFAGIEQSLEMKEFLWNNHFAAIASDMPALERWPPVESAYMHQTILGLWGMPIGEFFDLEALAKTANETERYTFFFSSWPLNIIGGVASPPNAAAIF